MPDSVQSDPHKMPLGRLVALTGQRLARHWQHTVAGLTGLSRTALTVLTVAAECGGLTHREVAEHCWVRPGTLTPVVDGLAAEGLLTRQRDPVDRRAVRLHITTAGLETLRAAQHEISLEFEKIVPRTDSTEDSLIRNYLLAVFRGLDEREGGS